MNSSIKIATNMAIQTHKTIQSFRNFRRTVPPSTKIGFVPTMGALHEGHLALVKAAKDMNDIVVASIYVNPTQFAAHEDLNKYPRMIENDTKLLNDLGVDHLFAPSDMYGKYHSCYVVPEGFDKTAEGQARPSHFRGVATIVNKLFNIIQPTNAYFGQKDAAQCVLIKRLVNDLDLDINICIIDTIREKDGLAMSSRNAYLNSEERKAAVVLYQGLCAAKDMYDGMVSAAATSTTTMRNLNANDIREKVTNALLSEKLVTSIQYVSVDSKETMMPLDTVEVDEGAIVSIACQVGSVRLIDNIVL